MMHTSMKSLSTPPVTRGMHIKSWGFPLHPSELQKSEDLAKAKHGQDSGQAGAYKTEVGGRSGMSQSGKRFAGP